MRHVSSTKLPSARCVDVVLGVLAATLSLPYSAADEVIKLPADTHMLSYFESVASKERVETYRNKVFLAEDGRKRVESLTATHGLISIFDDWGIQRLIMRTEMKTASVWDEIEPLGLGPEKLPSWIKGFQQICDNAEKELGFKKLDGRWTTGLLAKEHDRTFTIWVDSNTGLPVRIGIDGPDQYKALTGFQFHSKLVEPLFQFDAPEGYKVVEHHRKPGEELQQK